MQFIVCFYTEKHLPPRRYMQLRRNTGKIGVQMHSRLRGRWIPLWTGTGVPEQRTVYRQCILQCGKRVRMFGWLWTWLGRIVSKRRMWMLDHVINQVQIKLCTVRFMWRNILCHQCYLRVGQYWRFVVLRLSRRISWRRSERLWICSTALQCAK